MQVEITDNFVIDFWTRPAYTLLVVGLQRLVNGHDRLGHIDDADVHLVRLGHNERVLEVSADHEIWNAVPRKRVPVNDEVFESPGVWHKRITDSDAIHLLRFEDWTHQRVHSDVSPLPGQQYFFVHHHEHLRLTTSNTHVRTGYGLLRLRIDRGTAFPRHSLSSFHSCPCSPLFAGLHNTDNL